MVSVGEMGGFELRLIVRLFLVVAQMARRIKYLIFKNIGCVLLMWEKIGGTRIIPDLCACCGFP
jgi:hypothetical protein